LYYSQKFLIAVFLALIFISPNLSAEESSYKELLISNAEQLKLYADPQWIALLHYKTDLWGRYESTAERNSIFFNAADGKINPQSEMRATIEKFFEKSPRQEGEESQPFQCAFMARYSWLKSQLNFDPKLLPEDKCKRFDDWYKAMNPEGITLIFPSTYINNPASAFGHTLLRIDQPGQDESTRLLAYTAHFAAATGGENALLYALKGIFGGYPGFFSVLPYYEKVKQYSDLEKRDIWEYQLNIEKSEIDLMLQHLWELRSVAFSYYYFDENCAYHLLSLLDVARPSLGLLRASGIWVLPIDTVRALTKRNDLVKNVVFRPSVLTKLNYSLSSMQEIEKTAVKKVAKGSAGTNDPEFQKLNPNSKAVVLDAAYEYLNYKILSGDASLQKNAYSFLNERSSLPKGKPLDVPVPKLRPEESHSTAKLGAAFGRDDNKWFYDLRYRGVYHDLMDPKEGFSDGAQIELMDTIFRQKEEDNFRLKKAEFVNIISLSPGNELIKPKSWNINFGFDTQNFEDHNEHLYFKLEGGFGYSWMLSENIIAYGLLDLSGKFGDDFENSFAAGIKPKSGIYYDPLDSWRVGINAAYGGYLLGDDHNETTFGLEQRLTLSRNTALRLEFKHEREFSEYDNETVISFDYYL
jgi:hypothetical protein